MDTLSSAAEIGMGWEQAWRAPAIAPVLRWTVAVCLAMSIMVLVDRVYMGIVIMGVKLSRRRGVKKYKWEPIKGDLEVKSEAYPMKASLWKKLYVIYSFFFVRKIVIHVFTFIFHCVVLPATVLVPEVEVPAWGTVYIPLAIAILKVIGTPRSAL
ncbi:hypothetical protein C3L33_17656, partial [Rhododendron williamsianum]